MATKKKEPSVEAKPRAKRAKAAAALVEPAPVASALVEVAPVASAAVEVAPVASEPVAFASALTVDEAPRSVPSHDTIAARAAQLFSERGGSAFDNWIQAERELSA